MNMYNMLMSGSAEVAGMVFQWIGGILLGGFGVALWHYRKKQEPLYEARNYLFRKKLDAYLAVWPLLAYMTEVENPNAVIIWVRQNGKTEYSYRPANAKEFMCKLADIFYTQGYGLLMDKDAKDLLFEYRNILYGMLLKDKSNNGETIRLNNPKMRESMLDIYNKLNQILRTDIESIRDGKWK